VTHIILAKTESPCATCERKKKGKGNCSLKCQKRQDYADLFKGTDQMKAVDTEDAYRFMAI